ncbi:MAG: methyltransferase, TIGR04325 family [Thermoanaerobaculia bacterium]
MNTHDLRRVARAVRQLLPSWTRVRPWRSVHERWKDVPVSGPGYAGAGWADDALKATRSAAHALTVRPALELNFGEHLYLPLIAALVAAERGRVRIVDIGGSLGLAFHYVKALVAAEAIEYHIVETPETIELASHHPDLTNGVAYHPSLPDLCPDVVHLGSVLQYIEHYAEFLGAIANRSPQYILFVNTPFVQAPAVAAAQVNIKGSVIAYWFLNLDEIVAILGHSGYDRVFVTPTDRAYDTRNLPPPYDRVSQLDVLFRRRA